MYFYIDESGHSGSNLFDINQPYLYYGTLSSKFNIDILALSKIHELRKKLEVKRLHANELGNSGIAKIVDELLEINKKFNLNFYIFRINKIEYAIISFFDQVFDSGLNPAVKGEHYWTPLRYQLILELATLFDEDLTEKAWEVRVNYKEKKEAVAQGKELCQLLLQKIEFLKDKRIKTIIQDSLLWAASNFEKLYYSANSIEDFIFITPNLIGFSAVLQNISDKTVKYFSPIKITVDQQKQFNKYQELLLNKLHSFRNLPPSIGPGLPETSFKNIPNLPLTFCAGRDSGGLELVDIYLWVFRRHLENQYLAKELKIFVRKIQKHTRLEEVSLKSVKWRSLEE